MAVFVLNKRKKPLMPCSEKRARLLLARGKAVVIKMYPFTIRLKKRISGETQSIRLKIDPGSKHTGIALVRESKKTNHATGEVINIINVLNLFQLSHRGWLINKNLTSRSALRRNKRNRKTRYRQARMNPPRPKGRGFQLSACA